MASGISGEMLGEVNTAYKHRFFILLIFLILTLFTILLSVINPALHPLFLISFSLVILSGILATKSDRKFLVLAILLAVPAIIARWISFVFGGYAEIGGALFSIVFLMFFGIFILLSVLRDEKITVDSIAGAISIYLIMGLSWALSYQFMEQFQPGSLYFNLDIHPGGTLTMMDFVYFSFVTLSTLGYGDITPVTPTVQFIAYFEAVAGTIYLAVLIAWLVGSLSK